MAGCWSCVVHFFLLLINKLWTVPRLFLGDLPLVHVSAVHVASIMVCEKWLVGWIDAVWLLPIEARWVSFLNDVLSVLTVCSFLPYRLFSTPPKHLSIPYCQSLSTCVWCLLKHKRMLINSVHYLSRFLSCLPKSDMWYHSILTFSGHAIIWCSLSEFSSVLVPRDALPGWHTYGKCTLEEAGLRGNPQVCQKMKSTLRDPWPLHKRLFSLHTKLHWDPALRG